MDQLGVKQGAPLPCAKRAREASFLTSLDDGNLAQNGRKFVTRVGDLSSHSRFKTEALRADIWNCTRHTWSLKASTVHTFPALVEMSSFLCSNI